MEKLIFTSNKDSNKITIFDDQKLLNKITEKYDFILGYKPEEFNIVFLLIKNDDKNSKNDIWKTIFFKKLSRIDTDNTTFTLDNENELPDTTIEEIDLFKELDGNFEDVINIAVEVIQKFKNESKTN